VKSARGTSAGAWRNYSRVSGALLAREVTTRGAIDFAFSRRLTTIDSWWSSPGKMDYLRLGRTRVILGSFLLFALTISVFPRVDIQISSLFFDGTSFWNGWWQRLLKHALGYFVGLSLATVVLIYVCNRLLTRTLCDIDGRRVAYVFLVAVVGAGLIVNVALKDHLGRARPRQIEEFGGTRQFTPLFVPSRECSVNCSFSSGDAAGAFLSLALAKAFTRRRRYHVAALGFGALVSLARVSAGAHFFSDTVVSFFVMLIAADVFWHYVVSTRSSD
jgi:lipid A 4'-phosphatase